jgi:tetratricopeptide (TPR) repeat protein
MRLVPFAAVLAAAALAACGGKAARPAPPSAGAAPAASASARVGPVRPDLVPVSRAMTEIDQAVRRGTIAEARAARSRAAYDAPLDPAARFLALYALPRDEAGWEQMRQLTADLPSSALGYVGQAAIYVEWRVLDQADRMIVAALEREPENWLAVILRARVAEERGRLEAARKDLETALSCDPENPEAHAALARVRAAKGDAAGARAHAKAALATEPEHVPALLVLAGVAEAERDRGEAAAFLEQAADASPKDREIRVRLAKLLDGLGDARGARDQWREAVDLREDVESLTALAQAARLAGDAASEARALERLGAVQPTAAEWRRIADLRLASGDEDGADKALRRALAKDPKDALAHLGLARLHERRGEAVAAVESFRAAGVAGADELRVVEARLHLSRLEKPDVTQLQRAVQGLVDRTYRRRLAQVPSLSGNLRVRVTVDATGSATLVEVLEDSVHDPEVRATAYWNLKDAAYPQGKPGRFSFSFAFRK